MHRRLLTWTAIPVLVMQVGCAASGVRVPLPAPEWLPEADWRECEERAAKEADAAELGSTVGRGFSHPLAILNPLFPVYLALLPRFVPADIDDIRNARQGIFGAELLACSDVKHVEVTLGPEDPGVAKKLVELANRYAEGKYRREWSHPTGFLPARRSGYGTGPLMTEAEVLYERALRGGRAGAPGRGCHP